MKALKISDLHDILQSAGLLRSARVQYPLRLVRHCLIDSRNLHSADDTLFFAFRTQSNDGHKYIEGLYRRGLRSFVLSQLPDDLEAYPEADFLLVDDAVAALQALALHVRLACKAPVLAISGSYGKTIVKEWIWQLLRKRLDVTRSPGSYNSQIGVPLSLLELDEDTQVGIIEAGISRKGEMSRLESIILPTYGLLTNIGLPHGENFVSIDEKLREKCLLFVHCEKIVYCADDTLIDATMRSLFEPGRLQAWSMHDFPEGLFSKFPYDDEASLQNIAHALSCCRLLLPQVSWDEWREALATIEPAPMRLELKQAKQSCVLINDAYNSDVQALELALDFQSRREVARQMPCSLILSDIYRCGKDAACLYAEVAQLLSHYRLQRIVGIGPDLCRYASLFPASSRFFQTTEDFLASDLLNRFNHELILLKGSRRFGFERIAQALSLKSHQSRLEVNLDAIVHNYQYFRSLIKPSTKLIAMVKADAYGLGAVEISKTLQAQGCDALAVAVVDEGIALRQAGITIPVLVMNPDPSVLPLCYEYHLEPEIYSFTLLQDFLEEGQRAGVTQYPIHLKLDTGMHRLGFTGEDMPALIKLLQAQKTLSVSSVFTHLAGSDEACFDDYTNKQWQIFDSLSSQLRDSFPYPIDRHILNSAGIERFPQWQCERVRLGIGLYGISFVHPEALMPVAAFKTQILQLHHYAKGESVGYSRRGMLDRDSVVATIPVGYADGFLRSNRGGYVLINGQPAPILGNICMDACMVDVTDIPAHEGDVVEIFGPGLSISDMARRNNTIPYEILTSVSQRVKRVYYHE